MEVYLTRQITNEDGYIDGVINQVKDIPINEEMRMLITCPGGDVFQGDRIYRAILEHGGNTHAVVIGCACSMAASILSAFDTVEIDPGADVMFHKAHIPGVPVNELDESQMHLINRFNKKTYQRMKNRGVDAKFLSEVFLSESNDDYWLTPDQCEMLGIGKVVSVDRKKHKNNFKLAAKINLSIIKNKGTMNIFKKAVPRILNLQDGRTAIFESKNEELKKGDTLILANSNDKLKGDVRLSNTLVAEIGENGEVVDIKEIEDMKDDAYTEEMEMMKQEIAEIKKMVMELAGKGDDMEEMESKKEEDYDTKMKAATDLLNKTLEAVTTIKSTFQPPRIENKGELLNDFSDLSESEKRAIEMKRTAQKFN